MPHPGPKVADQNSGFKGQVKEIKQLFRDEVKRLVESLVSPSVIRPKLLNGKPVTVRKFIECVKVLKRFYKKIFLFVAELIRGPFCKSA